MINKFIIVLAFLLPLTAKAFIPLAGIAVLVEAAGGTVPFAISAATHAAVIGLITFAAKDNNPSSDLASKPITVQIDPNVPLTTPAGWSNDKTPPPSADKGLVCPPTNVNPGSSCGGACTYTSTMTFVDNGGSQCARYETISDVLFQPNSYGIQPGTSAAGFVDKIDSCPAGYVASGNGCSLNDPDQVKKPEKNKDEIQRVGNEFQRDPQQNPADNNPRLLQEAPNRISYTDVNTGEKVTIELDSVTGAATVTQSVPNYQSGTTSVQTTQVSGAGSGSPAVTGQITQSYEGTGSAQSGSPSSGGGGSSINFPNDYARTGEAASAAKNITDKLDEIFEPAELGDEDENSVSLPGSTFGNLFTDFNGLTVSGVGSCPASASFTLFNQEFSFSGYCSLLNLYGPSLQAAMALVWTIVAFFIVMGA